jgi:AAHS family 4-hydroxybenzoate transporter-like MFS transporter
MPIDIGDLLDRGSWPRLAKLVTVLCALALVFDGFDISIIGFAIPSILRDWHLSRASFAPLLVIGLVGMTVGSLSAGAVGDRIGRRTALVLSVLLFGIATVVSAFAPSIVIIDIVRFIAAAGIGGAIPNSTTLSAEFTPLRKRAVAVMLTIVCIPLGGALAGSVAAIVLPTAGWRALFLIGGVLPIGLAILMAFLIPESPRFLSRNPRRGPELVRLLLRLQHTVPAGATFVENLTERVEPRTVFHDFFGRGQALSTLALWLAFFSSAANVYMCFSWLPALLASEGWNLSAASNGLAAYNYGGVTGVLCFAALVNRFGSRRLSLIAASLGALTALVLISIKGAPATGHLPLFAALTAHGFCVNAVQTSLFALSVHLYPTRVRATGVAAGAAVGRLGGILSASIGPFIVQLGRAEFFKFLTFAMVVAFFGLAILRNHIARVATERSSSTVASL